MTKTKRQHAPDERAAMGTFSAVPAAPTPLQSPTRNTSKTNSISREPDVTQPSHPVKLPKTTLTVKETLSSHPFNLGKTVTQLSLPVTRIVPQHIIFSIQTWTRIANH